MKTRKLQNGDLSIVLTHDDQANLRMCLLEASEIPWAAKPAGVPEFAVELYALMTGMKPERVEAPKTFATKAELANGGGFTCTLGCGRTGLRTAARAQVHATKDTLQAGGHIARS